MNDENTTALDFELEIALIDDLLRDDVEAYAEWLRAQSDPYAELLSRELAAGNEAARDEVAALREEVLDALLDDARSCLDHEQRELGLSVHAQASGGGGELAEFYERFVGSSVGRFVRELFLGTTDYAPVVEAIAKTPPKALRIFDLRPLGRDEATSPCALEPLYASLPRVETFSVGLRRSGVDFGRIAIPGVTTFIATGERGLTRENLASIAEAQWPTLHTLGLSFAPRKKPKGATDPITVDELVAALRADHVPSLHSLGLEGTFFAGDIVAALAGSELVARLSTLDLSGVAFDGLKKRGRVKASAFLAHAAAFEHLDELVLPRAAVSDKLLARLTKRLPNVRLFPEDADGGAYVDE